MSSTDAEEFEIPRKMEVLAVPGRWMRGLGADMVQIQREGDCYSVKTNMTDAGRTGDTANKIIRQHYTAAIAALEEYRGRLDRSTISNEVFDKHVEMQHRTCPCGKQGLHDFSYAAISRSGIVLVEYRCIFCGQTQSFSLDHSR
jgi:hypothetical protein